MITDKIELDDLSTIPQQFHRILTVDPMPYFERAHTLPDFSHYKRYNTIFSETIFPPIGEKICACGCGKQLTGRRRRWATEQCRIFAFHVTQILSGRTEIIRLIMEQIYSGNCFSCGKSEKDFPPKTKWPERNHYTNQEEYDKACNRHMHELSAKIHLDHIIPVQKGGGCGWLSNYQFLCINCHKEKSKKERR